MFPKAQMTIQLRDNRVLQLNHESHMLKYSPENNHKYVSFEDFGILRNGYTNSEFKQKISEALFIKELCPSLYTQETSVPLLLYND